MENGYLRRIGLAALALGMATLAHAEMVEIGPRPNTAVLPYLQPLESAGDSSSLIAALRAHVKYVFVLFQENRSFDHYFGTYPGANGIFSTFSGASPDDIYARPANAFASFNSVIRDTDGSYTTISPFLIPRTIQNVNN